MSAESLSWAKRQKAGSTGRKALLLLLADVAGEHGVLWAGVDYLADVLECNRTTVMANLTGLQEAGLIARVERRKPNGARAGTVTVLAPGGDRGSMSAFEDHGLYGELLAENLSRDFQRGDFPRGENVEPKSGFTTRTNIEPESSANADDEKSARTRKPETDPDAIRLCRLLAVLIRENDPGAKLPADGSAARDGWVRDMRLLIADRGGDVRDVEDVIVWCQADPFWRSNILSPSKLRKQFTSLRLRMSAVASPAAPRGHRPMTAKEERMARRMAVIQSAQDQSQPQIEGVPREALTLARTA